MSERTVYAIASGKGGVGKTTTAINLGAMLAQREYSVVVVDTDLGMANLADFLDFEVETPTLHEVLGGDADFEESIYRAPGGIDVLPSATDIEAFTRSDPGNLQGVVEPLREEYDYVLLDTGAGVSYDTLVPLALADAVLLVATPDVASVRDTAKTGELAARVESEVAGAVLTQRSSDILSADDVEETLGTDVLAVVPQDEAVPMGIDAGRPLAAFAPNAPAGQAYRELAAVVTGEADPDPELDLGGDADVEFDAEPPRRDDESSRRTDDSKSERADDGQRERTDDPNRQTDESGGEDAVAGDEIAENVRDAIESGGESGGLLGGELASAAEEIRSQTADRTTDEPTRQSGESASGEPVEADAADAERSRSDPASAEKGDSDPTEASESESGGADEGQPRSVDDLLDEHMGDDRLGGDDSLSGIGDQSSDEGEESEAHSDGESSDGVPESGNGTDSERASEERVTDERATDERTGDKRAIDEQTTAERARNQSADPGSIPFEGESESPSAEAGDGGEESKAEFDAKSNAESEAESGSVESDAESGNVESGDVEAEGVKTGTLTDDDSSGILGRIGSLFK